MLHLCMVRVNMQRSENTILAIDQSYQCCGFAIYERSVLKEVKKLDFSALSKKSNIKLRNKHKRHLIRTFIQRELEKYSIDAIVVERVRTFSHGFISAKSIMALAELISVIIDAVPDNVPVFSVDTRSWKKIAIGSAKASKEDTIEWARQYTAKSICHDEADAIAIGHAYYNDIKLLIEE
jgi:Holliday junction resolvasome RuvABC endonuclease subunit